VNRLGQRLASRNPFGTLATVASFVFFLAISTLLYGNAVIANLSTTYIGGGHDPAGYIWSLVWWPYAVARGLNPFIARVIWTPVGFNLTWAAAIPGPSFLLWPITRCFGPVVSFNLIMLFTPAVVAWSAFLLCRQVSGRFFVSVLGGYLFGFSPYMIGHMLMGQPNLTLIFGVPLSAYLVLLRLGGAIRQRTLVVMLATVLTLQFLVSTEIVALMTVFGSAALAIALAVLPTERRMALLRTIPAIAIAYLISALLMAPFLYCAFAYEVPGQMHPVERCAADLLGYFVPSPMMLVGGKSFAGFADTLTPHVWYGGKGVYTNPALLIILILYARRHWRTPAGRLLILSAVVVVVCSLGPQFRVADRLLMPFPWRWIMKLPTLNQALPVRFAMFLFLIISVITSIVLSDPQLARPIRIMLGFLAVLLLLPNRHYVLHVPQQVDTPAFFAASTLETYVKPGDTLLILPFSIQGTTILWQAQTNMYFKMVGGYISSYVPQDYRQWAAAKRMLGNEPGLDFASQLKPFLSFYHVKGIVLAPEAQAKWRGPIAELGIAAKDVGGVLFYPVATWDPPT